MKLNRLGRALMPALLMTACVFPFSSQADSPDNLNIVWARTSTDHSKIFSQQSTLSNVVARYSQKYVLYLTGKTTDRLGDTWYEVSWPMKGWLYGNDAWFAPQIKDYNPDALPLPERLGYRLAIDFGNYPDASIKKFGKPISQTYKAEHGLVTQQLSWPELEIRYENSYKKASGAWIAALTVSKGSQYNFGPIHIGDSVAKLGEFGIERPQGDGEVTMGREYSFRFIIKHGKVDSMSYSYGLSDAFLPPKK